MEFGKMYYMEKLTITPRGEHSEDYTYDKVFITLNNNRADIGENINSDWYEEYNDKEFKYYTILSLVFDQRRGRTYMDRKEEYLLDEEVEGAIEMRLGSSTNFKWGKKHG